MRKLVRGALDGFFPDALVTYATGRRPGLDAEGTGPGMYYAWWIAQRLRERGVDCLSGLSVSGGDNWKAYLDKLGGRRSRCRWLLVVQTKALYESRPCLQEISIAVQRGVRSTSAGAIFALHGIPRSSHRSTCSQ